MEKEKALQSPLTSFIKKKFGDNAVSHEEMEEYLNSLIDPSSELTENQFTRIKVPWKEQMRMLGIMFQAYIEQPPQSKEDMFSFATRNDTATINHFGEIWKSQLTQNAKEFNITQCTAFEENGKQAYKPVIIAGAGPSLSKNINVLKEMRGDICLVSCLRNFAYFEDNGIKADYYVNLDAGEVTASEWCKNGKMNPEYYIKLSKDRVLVSPVVGHPLLHRQWLGEKKWFNIPTNIHEYVELSKKVLKKDLYFNVGGNVLGACLYFAQAVLGAGSIIFIGADFSNSYQNKFYHSNAESVLEPDKFGTQNMMRVPDVFGVPVWTVPSYYGFKQWFDFICMGGKSGVKCRYINCTEGGILGSYKEGNIRAIEQCDLETVLRDFNYHKHLPEKINNYNTALLI